MERKLDKYGFPIPATFDDLPEKMQREKPAPREKRKLSDRGLVWKRRIIVSMMILIAFIVIGVQYRKSIMQWVAESQAKTAREAYIRHEYERAKRYYGLAMWFDEENFGYRLGHAEIARQLHQLDEAYHDLTFIIDFKEPKSVSDDEQKQMLKMYQIQALDRRAFIQYQMEKPGPALADINRAVGLAEKQEPTAYNAQYFVKDLASLFNSRAYLRALTKTELKEGLVDANRALDLANNVPEYLDTRGYLYCLTEDYEKALADLDPAIEQMEFGFTQKRRSRFAQLRAEANHLRESLAVMYYHRSLAHKGLKNEEKANEDTLRAAEYGYDPKNGVF
jgi:hypothetical protein